MSTRTESMAADRTFTGMASQHPQMLTGWLSLGAPSDVSGAHYRAQEQCYDLRAMATSDRSSSQFLYRPLSGDFIIRAHLDWLEGSDSDSLIGLMLRGSLTETGGKVTAGVTPEGRLLVESWAAPGRKQEEIVIADSGPESAADVVQLERRGQRLIVSHARFGERFSYTELDRAELPDTLYVGVCVRATGNDRVEGRFHNLRLVRPAWAGLVPYQDYLGSRLELLDFSSGHRELIQSTPKGIEAPNWTPDGRALIYNSEGRLYRFDLASGQPEAINTGFAIHNNNDHVLSFDGTCLGVSHHSDDHNGDSIVYHLPATGGEPQPITDRGPSYLHGWSPDGRHVIYTGGRNGQYDIYRRAADGGGEEEALTDEPTLDDGSEYSPDGKSIFFNSARTGTMEIWRMDADGGNPQPLTDDELNNWFPHVSPDGETLVFLSYLPEVAAEDHPYYQQVYLRAMSVAGGQPRVIAYLYGGQGTINVPSWSPDGKRLAFVSHTQLSL